MERFCASGVCAPHSAGAGIPKLASSHVEHASGRYPNSRVPDGVMTSGGVPEKSTPMIVSRTLMVGVIAVARCGVSRFDGNRPIDAVCVAVSPFSLRAIPAEEMFALRRALRFIVVS